MEVAKKRKRDADLPRITYDAATRTFDRLFKEDSLEGIKDVVRKKLELPASTPIYLAQLRDGRTVDLEDDDDFEAFSSSAYHGLTARVKITVGREIPTLEGNTNHAMQSVSEERSPKKNTRKERKKKQNDALEMSKSPELTVAQTTPSDSPRPPKKRRVSFFEPSEEGGSTFKKTVAESNQPTSPNESESTPEQEPILLSEKSTQQEGGPDAELTTEERRKKKKKDKKEKKEKGKQKELSVDPPSKEGTPAETEPQKKKKKKKKGSTDEGDLTLAPTTTENSSTKEKAAETGITNATTNDLPQQKKSKKRSRAGESNDVDNPEADKTLTPNSSTEPELENGTANARGRESKKQKKAHKATGNADPIVASGVAPPDFSTPAAAGGETPIPKTPKKARRKSDAQPPVPSSSSTQLNQKSNASNERNGSTSVAAISATSAEKASKSKTSEVAKTQSNPSEKPLVEAKTPKRTAKKKVDLSETTGSAEVEMDKVRASIQALVARKAIPPIAKQPPPDATAVESTVDPDSPATAAKPATTFDASSAKTRPRPVIDSSLLQKSAAKTTSASLTHTDKPEAATSSKVAPASKTTKADPPSKCPVCEEEPGHVRSKCPIVKKGIKSMQKRIAELEKESASEDDEDGRAEVIAELQTLIEGKRRKPRTSLANTTTTHPQTSEPAVASAVKSVVDASTPSTAVNVVSSPAARPPNDGPIPAKAQSSTQLTSSIKPIPSIQSASSTQPAPSTESHTPSTQPPSTQPPSTQPLPSAHSPPSTQAIPSIQPPPSTQPKHAKENIKKSKAPRTSDVSLFPSPQDLSLPSGANLLAFGDVSSFTDRDILALMRGPKLTSKDVLSKDDISADGDEEEPGVLEEDEVLIRGPRQSSQRDYPSSSDEAENDEDEDENGPQLTESTESEQMVNDTSPALVSRADDSDEQVGHRSFRDMDATNTSRSSLEHAGDAAALAAINADLDYHTLTPLPTFTAAGADKAAPTTDGGESDTAVASLEEESAPNAGAVSAASATHRQLSVPSDNEHHDPIETIEEPPPSQPESIVSGDESPPPRESTPKKEIALRTRSQRNKTINAASSQPPASQSQTTQKTSNDADEATPKPTGRKTRSLTRISELPVPPNPSMRIIRSTPAPLPPVTPRTTRLRTRAESKTAEPDQADDTGPKNLAKTPARAAKTPVKPITKAAGKLTLLSKTSAKPPSEAAAKVLATSKSVGPNTRTRASKLTADLESSEERAEDVEADALPTDPEVSLASWAVLPDNGQTQTQSGPSQLESDQNTMLDELNSSPDVSINTGSGQQAKNPASQDPLFIHSASQQSLPYSQYPIPPERALSPSPNDSDDEEEVASVVRPSGRPSMPNYRRLSEITSQPTIFTRGFSSQLANNTAREPLDMFGTSGKDDEESPTESESEPESPPQSSHIPPTRRAGAAVPRRK